MFVVESGILDPDRDADWIESILHQAALYPQNFVKSHNSWIRESVLSQKFSRLVLSHASSLRKIPSKSVLAEIHCQISIYVLFADPKQSWKMIHDPGKNPNRHRNLTDRSLDHTRPSKQFHQSRFIALSKYFAHGQTNNTYREETTSSAEVKTFEQ